MEKNLFAGQEQFLVARILHNCAQSVNKPSLFSIRNPKSAIRNTIGGFEGKGRQEDEAGKDLARYKRKKPAEKEKEQ
jgi:hypothetical protein